MNDKPILGISNPELENCGLKELISKKSEAANRQKASKINKNQAVIIKKLEQEICNKTFELRSDRDIMVDLGLQDSLLNILFSYELPWIRLGLETIFGEIISVQLPHTSVSCPCRTGCVKWKNSIKFFVQQKLFSINNFTSKSMIYDQNVVELSHQNILKKMLSMILFLDNARLQKVLHYPRLFTIESNRKSTKDILFALHHELMRGKGDVTKYLNLTGYTVSFTQSYLDEYDFSVKNLTVRTVIYLFSSFYLLHF
jgi:abnormal spindle-like microcephaly-associated protein